MGLCTDQAGLKDKRLSLSKGHPLILAFRTTVLSASFSFPTWSDLTPYMGP